MFDESRLNMFLAPREITNWQDEQLSWKTSCFLHAGLSVSGTFRVTGPDAERMFSDIAVNNVARVRVGASTHLIMCSDRGRIMGHGMLLREGEQRFLTVVHPMHVPYAAESGKYDVEVEDLSGTRFIFQVAGPRSLEVIEAALREDLHDLRFLRHRPAGPGSRHLGVTGGELSVIRLGMSGTLAYEVHGAVEDAAVVYEALMAAGEPFGIRALGSSVYLNALHTETGFPNEYIHFAPAFGDDPGMMDFLNRTGLLMLPALHGSLGDDLADRYVTPYDVGWGHMVKLDHDFKGRAALEAIAGAPPRGLVTLVWNPDDVLEVGRSLYEPGAARTFMRMPADDRIQGGVPRLYNDQVLRGGAVVGMSTGRMYSWYYREMLSLGVLDSELTAPGTEVTVLWGEPGTHQKEIRAVVARYPYLDLERNEKVDVSAIPTL
ncbi:hypothetical protein [Nonomuraea sp. NPDC005650]|uniref:hypothetical protein n=1 Tax=Nonomuraea sp. NPDC005650 TaxID=3157045 RepID=UPI0033BB55C1